MDELHHECGVAALYYLPGHTEKSGVWTGDPDQLSRHMPRMLLDLQNRGQLAAGMASYNPTRDLLLDTYKDIGTVIYVVTVARNRVTDRRKALPADGCDKEKYQPF